MPQPQRRGLSTGAQVLIALGIAAVVVVGAVAGVGILVVADQKSNATPTAAAAEPERGEPAPWHPSPEPTRATPKTVVVKLGETIMVTRSGLSVEDEVHYTLAADKQYPKSPKFGLKPEKGIYYAVNATVLAVKGGTYVYSGDFALVASDGTVYESDSGFGFDRYLDGARLTHGQKTTGLVAFDVPPAALAGARIQLRPDIFSDGDEGYWQI
jgi:hypothetical protein